MKLKNFIKLFSVTSFLALSCCFISVSAANYKGIDYNFKETAKLKQGVVTVLKDVDDENIRIKKKKKMRDEHPNIKAVVTPFFTYRLEDLPKEPPFCSPGSTTCFPASVNWKMNNPMITPQDAAKAKSFAPFIMFDTVHEGVGGHVEYRADMVDPKYELSLTQTGGFQISKQKTRTYYSTTKRKAKYLICKFYVDPKIKKFFDDKDKADPWTWTLVADEYLFAKSAGRFVCKAYDLILIGV